MLALGRLLRLSLAPSALADVAAGVVFAGQGHWHSKALWLLCASACVYHGALALNDWHDRDHDARTRPSRPIPSAAVQPETALALGASLLSLGPLIALMHSREAACWVAGLALLAVIYDLFGRGPLSGPMLLASCRAGNLGLGLFFAQGSYVSSIPVERALIAMAVYAVYVMRVSQLGRMEDGEDPELNRGRPKTLVLSAAAMLLLVALLPPFDASGPPMVARLAALALAIPASITLARVAFARHEWRPNDVERAMGLALRRFLMFSATLAALAWRPPTPDALIVAAAILAGYAVSARLRLVFPPS